MRPVLTYLAFTAWLALPGAAAGRPQLRLLSHVGEAPPSAAWKYVRPGERVELLADLSPRPAAPVGFRWFKLEPAVGALDNTRPTFHFEPVRYVATELESCRDRPTCPADVTPTVLPTVALAPGLGSMAFQVTASLADGTVLASPGLEAVESGGLGRAVHRVAVRRDDTLQGYVTELFNTPYIFGSAGPDGRNQSDLLIGSDCADLIVYGRRRQGRRTRYTSSFALDQQAPERRRVASTSGSGEALDAGGKRIALGAGPGQVAVGDILHFPSSRHVALLWEDRPPLGVLDRGDLMVHTCWAPPTIEPISASSCASLPWRVLRFR